MPDLRREGTAAGTGAVLADLWQLTAGLPKACLPLLQAIKGLPSSPPDWGRKPVIFVWIFNIASHIIPSYIEQGEIGQIHVHKHAPKIPA